jgi:hypothetical protein
MSDSHRPQDRAQKPVGARWLALKARALRAPVVPPKRTNALRRALYWLAPPGAPGTYAAAQAITGTTLASLKHWLAGRRPMPGHVRDRLLEAVRARLAAGRDIEAALVAYVPPVRRDPIRLLNRGKRSMAQKHEPGNDAGPNNSV